MPDTIRWRILLVALAGWVSRRQLEVIAYLREENRVLKEHLGGPAPPVVRQYSDRRRITSQTPRGLNKVSALRRRDDSIAHRIEAVVLDRRQCPRFAAVMAAQR